MSFGDFLLTFFAFLGFGLGCGGGVALGTVYILRKMGTLPETAGLTDAEREAIEERMLRTGR